MAKAKSKKAKSTKAPSAAQVAARKKMGERMKSAQAWVKSNKRPNETHAQAIKRYFATK
jgi:hypothetical protein